MALSCEEGGSYQRSTQPVVYLHFERQITTASRSTVVSSWPLPSSSVTKHSSAQQGSWAGRNIPLFSFAHGGWQPDTVTPDLKTEELAISVLHRLANSDTQRVNLSLIRTFALRHIIPSSATRQACTPYTYTRCGVPGFRLATTGVS
jgi:hypothetical protein